MFETLAKIKCPICNETHDLEIDVDLKKIPDEMSEANEWRRGISECIVFKNPFEVTNENTQTIKDAKTAIRDLERDLLNRITDLEKTYGITIQHIDTNLTRLPVWQRDNGVRTNSVSIFGDL